MTIQQKLWLSFSATLALVFVVAVVGHSESKRTSSSEQRIAHTYKVLATIEAVISVLKDAETGQRGYLLTSEEAYLEPYVSALRNAPIKLQELATLIADNPEQQARTARLRILVAKKLDELKETIDLHRENNAEGALEIVKTNLGKRIMEDIRSISEAMKADENSLLKSREIKSDETTRSSVWIIYGGSSLIVLIGALVAAYTSKTIANDYNTLRSTKVSLAVANDELQNFVYRTSHDFKSPILGISSMVRFIEEDLKSGDIEEALCNVERIRKNATTLEAVVSSTLLLAKADLSDNHITPVHLGELTSDIYSRLDGLAEKHQVELKVGGILTSIIYTDRNHLSTALENIISNGIKYSDNTRDDSFVAINAEKWPSDSVNITISDNGIGIPKKRHSEVFGMFKQFHPNIAHGTGLGMYIVKKSVDRLGGSISFDSSTSGTEFHINIPMLEPNVNDKLA